MCTRITVKKFRKKHLEIILDEVVEPMYHYLESNSNVFESFQNRLLAYDLKYKAMYLVYTILNTDCEIIKELLHDFQQDLHRIGLSYDYYEACVMICFEGIERLLHKHFNPTKEQQEKWDKKLGEIHSFAIKEYADKASEDSGFIEESYDHGIKDFDMHHYSREEKIDAVTFMKENSIHPDEVNEIIHIIQDLEEHIDYNYQKGLNEELVHDFKDLIVKMIGFYELSGEFRTLTHPMSNLYKMLESLDLSSLDPMMKDVIFNFLNNTVKDMQKWVDEVLVEQSTNDIHYLDASILASISQMEMMIAGSDDTEEDEDDDFLF